MKRCLVLLCAAAFCLAISSPMFAGNIALTGHDDDFHFSQSGFFDTAPGAQLNALVTFARNGSTLPVLTFDAGSELTNSLTKLGIPFTNVNPNLGVAASLFNAATFSAFVVASDTTCGGCDNSAIGEANIAAQNTAINAFLNAGGGIVGLAGASSPGYYAFVPQTATSVGGAPSTGYSATGIFGIPAVNGDATHNLFHDPGTFGESSFYQVAETNAFGNGVIGPGGAATLVCFKCTTSGGVITGGGGGGTAPEPSSLLLMGVGLLALGKFAKKFHNPELA